jgi:uncharacterized protein
MMSERLARLPATLAWPADLHVLPLSSSHRVAFNPLGEDVGGSIAVLNGPAWEILSLFERPQSIDDQPEVWQRWGKTRVFDTLGDLFRLNLLSSPWRESLPLVKDLQVLSAWLHITDRCNLRCDYCYLTHTLTDMNLATGRAIVDATFRSALAHGYRAVKLKYAGGEPLLRVPLVLALHRYAQTLAAQHNLDLEGIVLSNGTLLTSELADQMQAAGLRLMISLDGVGAVHDSQRHFPDGRGSFQAVARAIDLACAADLKPDISITVSGRTIDGLPETVAWVLDRDLPFSLNFYRENDQSASEADLRLEEARIIAGMLAAYRVIEHNLPRRSLLASLADRANLSVPHKRTCSAGQSYLVFDTQGRVSKCQMDMAHPITDCNDTDPLETVRSSTTGLHNVTVEEKDECRECAWRYWCAGGCPLQTHRAKGRYDVQSPNCAIYKALYPEVVRLEGLRLLKYADKKLA